MRYLSLALLCAACGSAPVASLPDAPDASTGEDSSLPTDAMEAGMDVATVVPETGMDVAPLQSCVSGSWLVRIIPSLCPLCVSCGIDKTPSAYGIKIGDTIPILSCPAALTSVQDSDTCTYQNMDKCSPVADFGDAGTETFSWDGIVTFQRYTGAMPIAIVNGNILWEFFDNAEIGLSGLAYGLDAGQPCLYRILLVQGVE